MTTKSIMLDMGSAKAEAEITDEPQIERNPDQVAADRHYPVIIYNDEIYGPRDMITLPNPPQFTRTPTESAMAADAVSHGRTIDESDEGRDLVRRFLRAAWVEGWRPIESP